MLGQLMVMIGCDRMVQFGLTLPFVPIEDLLHQAWLAESAGFDTIWYPDHVVSPGKGPHLDCWGVLSAIAVSTRKIKMGPYVTDCVRRHPISTAHSVVSLGEISHGRALLGLGAGEPMNTKPFGIELSHPLSTLKRSVFTIQDFYAVYSDVPDPPIYLGVAGPKMLRLAGEIANGWLPYVQTLRNYPKMVANVRASGRTIDLGVNVPIYFARGGIAPDHIYRRLAIRLLIEGRTLHDYGFESPMTVNNMVVTLDTAGELEALAKLVPHEAIADLAVIGSASDVVERLNQYERLGATHFLIRLLGEDVQRDMDALKREVFPHFARN